MTEIQEPPSPLSPFWMVIWDVKCVCWQLSLKDEKSPAHGNLLLSFLFHGKPVCLSHDLTSLFHSPRAAHLGKIWNDQVDCPYDQWLDWPVDMCLIHMPDSSLTSLSSFQGEMGPKGEPGIAGHRGPTGRPGKRGKQVTIPGLTTPLQWELLIWNCCVSEAFHVILMCSQGSEPW